MTGKYAEGTSVPAAQTKAEIERTLRRYGASGFMYGEQADRAMIGFVMRDRQYRLGITYPPLKSFLRTKTITRSPAQAKVAQEAEIRRLWRSLGMIIKAKLEAVEAGISSIEKEFYADSVLPNNQTMYEWGEPQLGEMYASGRMPELLPGSRGLVVTHTYIEEGRR